MHNIKLLIAYDGSAYLGWQKTEIGPSIEATLQQALQQILQHSVVLQAASRTDAGVHACQQTVNFFTTKHIANYVSFVNSVNSLLPKDIIVLTACSMPLSFHPTLDSVGKEYHYYICNRSVQFPQHRFYSWHVPYALHLDDMYQSLPILIGAHHFGAFCNLKKNARYTNYVRHLQRLELIELGAQRFYFRIQGNHFLYRMVRTIVGTLVDIGKRKIALDELPKILHSQQRSYAGVTAPAHGLFLHEVYYATANNMDKMSD